MEGCQKFDNTLFSVLQECANLPAFLDVIFGFLSRRTDFYCIADTPNSPIGLPEGWAEEFVRRAYFKWKPKENDNSKLIETPPVIEDVEVYTTPLDELKIEDKGFCDKSEVFEEILNNSNIKSSAFAKSEYYNGAAYDNYCWSQTINEIDISVKVPDKTITRDLSVIILSKKITVKLKKTNEMLLDGELSNKCKHLDAIWSLDKNRLLIHLEKNSETWWDCFTLNEPKLDISKIDCSRPFEELSEEAQAKIEELTWNQERKRQGLPTSEEIILQDRLKKAWNADGSPFSGPFDPSVLG